MQRIISKLESSFQILAAIFALTGVAFSELASAQPCEGQWLSSSEQTPIGMNGPVFALAKMPNGDLVAGGSFGIAGSVNANRIARWNGSRWAPIGSGGSGG